METVSFSTFTHLKGETIQRMIERDGKIGLNIKPKKGESLRFALVDAARLAELEALEAEVDRLRLRDRWGRENEEAIAEQNARIEKRGLFGAEFRRF